MKWLVFCCLPLVLCFVRSAAAGDCCGHCGCHSNCSKVCRLVCETKKVPKIVYECECEDFCVPGKSDCCVVCDECGHRKKVYTPTCGEVRTRTKLVKHVEFKEVPSYKCVVVDLCPACAQRCAAQDSAGQPQDQLTAGTSSEVLATSHTQLGDAGQATAEPAADNAANEGWSASLRHKLGSLFSRD